MVQDHAPAIRGEFVNIGRDDLDVHSGFRLAGLDLLADAVDGEVAGLGTVVTHDMELECFAPGEYLLPAKAYRACAAQACCTRVNTLDMIRIHPDGHHGIQVAPGKGVIKRVLGLIGGGIFHNKKVPALVVSRIQSLLNSRSKDESYYKLLYQEVSEVKQTVRYLCICLGILVASTSWAALKDFNGNPQKLSEYTGNGKWTVVMFWASDCRVCNAEIGQYIAFNQAHKDKDARIVGVSLDGQSGLAAARDFIKRHNVTFPNLVGEPQDVAELYQSLTGSDWVGTPSFLVYNPQGKLMAAQAGAVPTALIEKFIKSNSQSASATQ